LGVLWDRYWESIAEEEVEEKVETLVDSPSSLINLYAYWLAQYYPVLSRIIPYYPHVILIVDCTILCHAALWLIMGLESYKLRRFDQGKTRTVQARDSSVFDELSLMRTHTSPGLRWLSSSC
jgi:hypothetical protein